MAALTAVVSVALALPVQPCFGPGEEPHQASDADADHLRSVSHRRHHAYLRLARDPRSDGPAAWIASGLGMTLPPLIGTLWAVGLGTVQVLIPAAVVILLPAVLRLDPELEQASSTLGARPYRTFFQVTLPQLRVACFGALTACWAFSMGEFADPAVLGQGVKDYVANFLQGRYLSIGDPPLGSAVGMILLASVARWSRPPPHLEQGSRSKEEAVTARRPTFAAVVTLLTSLFLVVPTIVVLIASLSTGRPDRLPAARPDTRTGTDRSWATRRHGMRS